MPQKQAVERVAFAQWQDHPTDIYTVRVGPATCEFRRKDRVLRLRIFGRVQDIPLGGGTTLTYAADWGSLQVTDVHYDGSTEFKLTWDDHFEERGARASEYVSVGVPRNLVPREDVFDVDNWAVHGSVAGVSHFDRSLGQSELVKLTSPAVERDKRLLLCT